MINLLQKEIVNLFLAKIELHLISSKRGTYNKADPTEYQKGTAILGLSWKEIDEGINVEVKYNDVTWGVEIEMKVLEDKVMVQKGYFSWPCFDPGKDGEWMRTTEGFFDLFKNLLLHGDKKDFWLDNGDDLDMMLGGNPE